jgi:hypothetical protein
MKLRNWKAWLLGGVACGLASVAQAGVLPISETVTLVGGKFNHTYSVIVTNDSVLQPGDFFTVYDFGGLVPDTNLQPANFTFSTALATGASNDDPAIANLTWTYTGGTPLTGTGELMQFTASSTASGSGAWEFASKSHLQDGSVVFNNFAETIIRPDDDDDDDDDDDTPPGGDPQTPPGVPEPTTLALLAAGVPLAMFMRRRKDKNVA